ncbi:putative bifunctional diguanylate cyclase/phosphodiesterase [Marinobacter sp. SS21]|uniref:putative bifunctional diguanylate cyclase/phosphodiesterase n=1 Tax=Marinobacter sp. SS21 TaxID=2979460 RepID=UPI00232FB7D1|nr:GGDEF domain-containing phosphodiesterase [Marinobacter sp. SS21]MDC0661482.1 GGDEF domain-containing phosphodiesterase [Marinobacter sp. SS21]
MLDICPRQAFIALLQRHVTQSLNHSRCIGLAFIKFRNLRENNLHYGYEAGDLLLAEAYSRLQQIAKSDECLVRTGCNEFALILPFLVGHEILELACAKLETALMEEYSLGQKNLYMLPQIGMSYVDSQGQSATDLCQSAERALAIASQGSARRMIVDPAQDAGVPDYDLYSGLSHALEVGDFELYLQPQVELRRGRCVSFEALIRWKQDTELVPPDVFIGYAETSNLIFPLTKWIINNALRQLQALGDKYDQPSTSVNISGACFDEDRLIREVANALSIWGVAPSRLTLEITETVFMKDMERTKYICDKLRNEVGVRISIDDFGTGYSSFEFFKHISADELKIDQSFVKSIGRNGRDRHIVGSILALAKGLNMTTVAEGIEDLETLFALSEMGADVGQGYFIAKPFSEKNVQSWLDIQARLVRAHLSVHA